MKFKLENTDENLDGEIVKSLGNNEFVLKIQGKERDLKIITMTHDKVEFMLDSVYHTSGAVTLLPPKNVMPSSTPTRLTCTT